MLPYLIIKTMDLKPTIAACDADNTATSVKKNDNDNKKNCATDEDSACTMTLTVPNAIKKVNRILPCLIIKTMDFPHCSDCLQLENIALGHLTTIYSRLNGVNNCCEMPQSIIS
jgi:hypothetical protein